MLDRFGLFRTILLNFVRSFWPILDHFDHSGNFWKFKTILEDFGPFWEMLDYFG